MFAWLAASPMDDDTPGRSMPRPPFEETERSRDRTAAGGESTSDDRVDGGEMTGELSNFKTAMSSAIERETPELRGDGDIGSDMDEDNASWIAVRRRPCGTDIGSELAVLWISGEADKVEEAGGDTDEGTLCVAVGRIMANGDGALGGDTLEAYAASSES